MSRRRAPWWVWLVAGIVLLNVFSEAELPVVPLLLAGLVAAKVLGQRSRPSGRPGREHRVGPGVPMDTHDTWTPPASDRGMPTIEVPRYPGEDPTAAGPPPVHGTSPVPASGPAAAAPHTSSDPVVSLGQLHLSRCGRDLQAAVGQGSAAEVTRVLDEVEDLSARMQDMLGAAAGTPGPGRREFRSGLRAIDRLVEDARGEPSPAKLTRLTQACLRMGQTGRHE